jgi:hypothetical protein
MSGVPLQVPPMVNVNAWDNHAVHVEIHNRFRKSQAYQLLDDVIKAEFQKHISMHEQALQEQMMQQQMMQMAQDPQQLETGAKDAPDQAGITDQQLG